MTTLEGETSFTDWQKIRAIAFARAFSFFGSQLTVFALVLREKDSGAGMVSLLFILGTLPFIVLAPWAGLIADKYSTKQVVGIGSILQAILIFSLTFDGPKWALFATLFISNSCSAATNPAWGALIPTLSTKDDLPRTIGFSQSIFAFAGLLAPISAGFLVSTSGFYIPFVIDAFTFLLVAFVPIVLKVNRFGVVDNSGEKIRALDGIEFLFREPLLRALVILLAVFILALGVVNVGEVFLVTEELGASALIYGFIGGAFAIGALLGSAAAAAVKVPENQHVKLVIIALGLLSIAVMGIALAGHWMVVLVFSFIAGLGNSGINAYAVAIFMNKTESSFQGRMMAGVSGVINFGGIIALGAAGPLIGIFGVREVLTGGGTLSMLVLILLAPEVIRQSRKRQQAANFLND